MAANLSQAQKHHKDLRVVLEDGARFQELPELNLHPFLDCIIDVPLFGVELKDLGIDRLWRQLQQRLAVKLAVFLATQHDRRQNAQRFLCRSVGRTFLVWIEYGCQPRFSEKYIKRMRPTRRDIFAKASPVVVRPDAKEANQGVGVR